MAGHNFAWLVPSTLDATNKAAVLPADRRFTVAGNTVACVALVPPSKQLGAREAT